MAKPNWKAGLSALGQGLGQLPGIYAGLDRAKLDRQAAMQRMELEGAQESRVAENYKRSTDEDTKAIEAIAQIRDLMRQSELPGSIEQSGAGMFDNLKEPAMGAMSPMQGEQGTRTAQLAMKDMGFGGTPTDFEDIANMGNMSTLAESPKSADWNKTAASMESTRGKIPQELIRDEGLDALAGLPLTTSQSPRAKSFMESYPSTKPMSEYESGKLGLDAKAALRKEKLDAENSERDAKEFALKEKKFQLELDKLDKEANKVLTDDQQKAAKDLRSEYITETKDFRSVRDAFNTVNTSNKGTAASDISMIFAYMKMLDPQSTVREGEFATAQQATGVPDRVLNVYNKTLEGVRLSPDQRNDFVARAKDLYGSREKTYRTTQDEYKRLASDYGVPDKFIIVEYANQPDSSGQSKVNELE